MFSWYAEFGPGVLAEHCRSVRHAVLGGVLGRPDHDLQPGEADVRRHSVEALPQIWSRRRVHLNPRHGGALFQPQRYIPSDPPIWCQMECN